MTFTGPAPGGFCERSTPHPDVFSPEGHSCVASFPSLRVFRYYDCLIPQPLGLRSSQLARGRWRDMPRATLPSFTGRLKDRSTIHSDQRVLRLIGKDDHTMLPCSTISKLLGGVGGGVGFSNLYVYRWTSFYTAQRSGNLEDSPPLAPSSHVISRNHHSGGHRPYAAVQLNSWPTRSDYNEHDL
jgi:hypothetical protein